MTSSETGALADYMARSPQITLPPEVKLKTKLHILDTLAAIVSGSRLSRAG